MADMDSHILEGLTLRLEAAERGLRGARRAMWMGSILVVLAIGGAAWWLITRAQVGTPTTIEAQHFVVRDAQGAARGLLELTDDGATQLVFFRDALPGEEWRAHAKAGPFSFGVRSLSAHSQLVLGDREGANCQLTTGNLSFAINERPKLMLGTDSTGSRIWLADTTGNMQVLSAGLLADVAARRSEKASHPPKRRRGH